MTVSRHVFHTRHDFTPEFAWAAFQLLSGIKPNVVTTHDLHSIAQVTASPLAKRSDLSKLLAAMTEIGLTERRHEHVTLSALGESLAKSLGLYREGFYIAVHCLYFWTWLWKGAAIATPSWSYREVCRQLLDVGTTGVNIDELVLRVVSSASDTFQAEKISFSRSSVTGITMWLEAQSPPLIQRRGSRIFTNNIPSLIADMLRLNLAALCRHAGEEAYLGSPYLRLLAECLLISTDELMDCIVDFVQDSKEFLLIPSAPSRLIFNGSEDPFIRWIVKSSNGKSTIA